MKLILRRNKEKVQKARKRVRKKNLKMDKFNKMRNSLLILMMNLSQYQLNNNNLKILINLK